MVGSGTLIDPGMVYFAARLSERYPTVEIRIAETAARSWREGKPASPARTELLRLAAWRASR